MSKPNFSTLQRLSEPKVRRLFGGCANVVIMAQKGCPAKTVRPWQIAASPTWKAISIYGGLQMREETSEIAFSGIMKV